MKQFLIKSVLFAILPVLWAIFIFFVDPYDYFNHDMDWVSQETKKNTSYELNLFTRTMISYHNNPTPFLLVGDSRTKGLPISHIQTHTKDRYTSLAIPAAKVNEMIELIYFAHSVQPLEHVITGFNFTMFNEYAYANRVGRMTDILQNPLLYIFNRPIASASFYAVRGELTGIPVVREKPTKEQVWDTMMAEKPKHWFGRYQYSESLEKKITDLSSFMKKNNIRWTVFLVPHYAELRSHIVEYGRQEDEKRFKALMKTLHADVIDYDYDGPLTQNAENFDDPVHYNKQIGAQIIDEFWTEEFSLGRVLKKREE